jgi:hypothetical protein
LIRSQLFFGDEITEYRYIGFLMSKTTQAHNSAQTPYGFEALDFIFQSATPIIHYIYSIFNSKKKQHNNCCFFGIVMDGVDTIFYEKNQAPDSSHTPYGLKELCRSPPKAQLVV